MSLCKSSLGAGEPGAHVCLPKCKLDSSGIETSRSPLAFLPGGVCLGLPPGFEPGQHVPAG